MGLSKLHKDIIGFQRTHFYFVFVNIITSEVMKYPRDMPIMERYIFCFQYFIIEPGHTMVLERALLFACSKKNDGSFIDLQLITLLLWLLLTCIEMLLCFSTLNGWTIFASLLAINR